MASPPGSTPEEKVNFLKAKVKYEKELNAHRKRKPRRNDGLPKREIHGTED
jgi:hypothetical protein